MPCISFSMDGKCAELQILRLGVRNPVKAMLIFKITSYAVFLGQLKMPCMSFSMNGKCAELGIWGLEVRTPVEAMLISKMISYAVFLSQLQISCIVCHLISMAKGLDYRYGGCEF